MTTQLSHELDIVDTTPETPTLSLSLSYTVPLFYTQLHISHKVHDSGLDTFIRPKQRCVRPLQPFPSEAT